MNLENIIQNVNTKEELLQKILETPQEKYDFVLKYYKITGKFMRYLNKITEKIYRFKHIPYIGFSTDKKVAKELIGYYLNQENTAIGKDLKKMVKIKLIDVVSDVKAIPLVEAKVVSYDNVPLGELWNLSLIGVYYAREFANGSGVKVGVIDTGIDYKHQELKDNFGRNKGYDFIRESEDPFDYESHGTHVAGIIAGNHTGVAPKVQLYALRILDENGSGTEFDLIRAIEWAYDHKLDIVNMSLGSPYASNALAEICKYVKNKMLLVAAAGNDGTYSANYPAALDGVISVGAIDKNKKHASFSNIHNTLDISAPGVEIFSSVPYNEYAYYSGTSMATPHVTGTLALLKSIFNQGLYEELMKITAEKLETDLDYDNFEVFGAGLVRADKLISFVLEKDMVKRRRLK